jgi:serine/threonine protein kinase/TolB-like protein/Tfp pilus assembly protein PilF
MSAERLSSLDRLATGTRVGNYEITGSLGAGAMGQVYRARDARLGRDVALKLLTANPSHDATVRDRAEREARIIASLNHPNVLAIYDVGSQNGATYLVTELVDGESLRGLKPTLRKALEMAEQIAEALAAAHAAGVTHRDLKPDNVMVTRDGRVKLLDFGVAKTVAVPAETDETIARHAEGVVTGTVGYMAPEQIRAVAVDGRADVFSFGALFYELLTGNRAFPGETTADVVAAVLHADPPEISVKVPDAVCQIIQRCLEKNPDQRFQSARDLAFAIRQAASTTTPAAADVHDRAIASPSPSTVREQLVRLIASSQLTHAERLSALLRFIVEETLNGRAAHLKEARIGLDVFGRKPDSYDPAIDPIVRVQMGRLRTKMRAYYNGDGANDPVRIDIPVGSYVATFALQTRDAAAQRGDAALAPVPDDLRIAVLPIVNISADPENQYFCDGLTEELINRLAQIPQLRVVARTSSFQFKDAARDIREVGRLLDVSKVLEGSVRKAGNRIRATVQLINVSDGCHVWSERYEGDLTDIFAIHEQISIAVGRALQMKVLGGSPDAAAPAAPPPRSVEAYNHYLQGRFLWKKRTEQGLKAALDHFEQASRLDSSLARAFSGIADCHLMLGLSAAESPDRCMPEAARAASHALKLDSSLAEAHASLAAVNNCYEWDLDAAEAGYRRSIALDSSYATTLHWLGLLIHGAKGDFAAAIECHEQAIELDPLSPPIIADLGLIHAFHEDFDRASMYCRRALELDPHFHRPFWFLGLSLAWSGDLQKAEDALTQGLELCQGAAFRSRLLGALGFTYGRAGKRERVDEVKRELGRMRAAGYVPSFELAQIEIGTGNTAGALACLENAVIGRESFAIFLKSWRSFAPLLSELRFRSLLAQVGLGL